MPFDENMNIIGENRAIDIKIDPLTGDLNIISKLDDEPNDVGGLSAQELKAEFDKGGNIIKDYLNDTLIPAVVTQDATEQDRAAAEAARVEAEAKRVQAETGRVDAESARVSKETDRVNAETGRVNAEADRVAAEQGRVAAEQGRVAAEQGRVDETAGIVAQATEQANRAKAAADSIVNQKGQPNGIASLGPDGKVPAEQIPDGVGGLKNIVDGEGEGSVGTIDTFYNMLGPYAFSEGSGTVAQGECSHAEGYSSRAMAKESHAEGHITIASGVHSHAEGSHTSTDSASEFDPSATGLGAHTEGVATYTGSDAAHAEGLGTVAIGLAQHAQGRYNVFDREAKYAHIVGNGGHQNSPSNAHTLDWSGNAWFSGKVKVGGTSYDDPNAKTLVAQSAPGAEGQFAVFNADGTIRGVTLPNLDTEAR